MKRILTVAFLTAATLAVLHFWPKNKPAVSKSSTTTAHPAKSFTIDDGKSNDVVGSLEVTIDPGTETQEPLNPAK